MIYLAAILYEGNIYTGRRHHEIIREMVEMYGIPPPITGTQGFIDEKGNFLSREESRKMAIACGQVKEEYCISNRLLFSEDLY